MTPGSLQQATDAGQPQDLIALLMHTYARDVSTMVWSGCLVNLMNRFGFSEPATRMALSRMVRRGAMRRVKQGRRVHYFLDDGVRRAHTQLDERIARLREAPRPVREWTVVWRYAPEDEVRRERGQFARRLRAVGFGVAQGGLWLAPHDRRADVAEIADELELDDDVAVLVGQAERGLVPRSDLVWDLPRLGERYEEFCELYRGHADPGRIAELGDEEAFVLHARVLSAYRTIAVDDPGLQCEDSGLTAHRHDAATIAVAVDSALSDRAQRHFDAVNSLWMGRVSEDTEPGRAIDAVAR